MLRTRFYTLAPEVELAARSVTSFTSLPIIDISPLVNNTSLIKERRTVGKQLHAACENVGFFYAVNHGMPAAKQLGVLSQARNWFALPESDKERIALSPARHYRGWQRLGTNVTRYSGGYQRDWHEAIDLYREVQPCEIQSGSLKNSPIHGCNPWPDQIPEFATLLRQYIDGCLSIGAAIMRGIALGLRLPECFFEGDKAGDPYWVTRVIHYPPLTFGPEYSSTGRLAIKAANGAEVERTTQLSCGEHTDYGLLTLVNQDSHVTALQVKNASGKWINAEPLDGSFVCNIGDMLKVWTNGLYTPTVHRVVNLKAEQSRVSIPFFYEPCFGTEVKPVANFCPRTPGEALQPVCYGTHLEQKILSNFEL